MRLVLLLASLLLLAAVAFSMTKEEDQRLTNGLADMLFPERFPATPFAPVSMDKAAPRFREEHPANRKTKAKHSRQHHELAAPSSSLSSSAALGEAASLSSASLISASSSLNAPASSAGEGSGANSAGEGTGANSAGEGSGASSFQGYGSSSGVFDKVRGVITVPAVKVVPNTGGEGGEGGGDTIEAATSSDSVGDATVSLDAIAKVRRECPRIQCHALSNSSCPLENGVCCGGTSGMCCPADSTCLTTDPPTCVKDSDDDDNRCADAECKKGHHCPLNGVATCCIGGTVCCQMGYKCRATNPPTCEKLMNPLEVKEKELEQLQYMQRKRADLEKQIADKNAQNLKVIQAANAALASQEANRNTDFTKMQEQMQKQNSAIVAATDKAGDQAVMERSREADGKLLAAREQIAKREGDSTAGSEAKQKLIVQQGSASLQVLKTLVSAVQSAPIQSKLGCENSVVTISCPGAAIEIVDASFGRHDTSTCPMNGVMSNTNCNASTSMPRITELCNKRTACAISASNSVFGDPCPGTYKYLTVKYKCI